MREQSTAGPSSLRTALYLRTGAYPELGQTDTGQLQAYAAQHGYHVVETYRDEGAAGKDRLPPGLTQLLEAVAQGRIDVVLVPALATLAGTPQEAQAVVEELQQRGASVDSLNADVAPATKGAAVKAPSNVADASRVHVGMEVYGSNGGLVGTVKAVYDADVWVDRTMQRDVFVPYTAMQAVTDDTIVLNVISGRVGDMGWAKPTITGQERP